MGTDSFQALVDTFNAEYSKFQAGNKSAGTRARKALSEIAKMCKTLRNDIQTQKNSK